MEENPTSKPDFESALYTGAAVTAIIALLPYVNVFIIPAFVIGAIVAVSRAVARVRRPLRLSEGAKLGFLAPFFGTVAAAVVVDIIWQFFDYQLWQSQNAHLMLSLVRSFAGPATVDAMSIAFEQNAAKSFAWYMIIVQLLTSAIMSGIFGTLAGLITAAATAKRASRNTIATTPA